MFFILSKTLGFFGVPSNLLMAVGSSVWRYCSRDFGGSPVG
jgi:hypothetical protein